MATELLRDKLVNLSNEVNNFKLQLWQQELILVDVRSAGVLDPKEDDPVRLGTHAKLTQGYVDAASQAEMLRVKIANRTPVLAILVEEQAAIEAAAAKAAA